MTKIPDSDEQILRDFNLIRLRFTSLETMAEALRAHEGFQDLNRATLSRWLTQPSKRTRAALEILRSRRPPAVIRIAENKTLSVIPSSMLQWEIEEGTPHGLLASRYEMKPEVHATSHGNESFEFLANGRADIAIVPGDLVPQLPDSSARLCLLSKVYIAGISTRPVPSAFDLKNKRFALLAGSSFVARLTYESRNWGFDLIPPLVLPSLQECVQAVLDGKAHCIAGWEPFVTYARRAIERNRPVHTIPHGVLGWFEMHVAVNLKTAHPGAVRAYLAGLQESVSYTNGRKSVAAFHSEIGRRYNLEPSEVRNILANIIFGVSDLDAATTLKLWEREALFHSLERNTRQQDSNPLS
jgi:hypothetical protein